MDDNLVLVSVLEERGEIDRWRMGREWKRIHMPHQGVLESMVSEMEELFFRKHCVDVVGYLSGVRFQEKDRYEQLSEFMFKKHSARDTVKKAIDMLKDADRKSYWSYRNGISGLSIAEMRGKQVVEEFGGYEVRRVTELLKLAEFTTRDVPKVHEEDVSIVKVLDANGREHCGFTRLAFLHYSGLPVHTRRRMRGGVCEYYGSRGALLRRSIERITVYAPGSTSAQELSRS